MSRKFLDGIHLLYAPRIILFIKDVLLIIINMSVLTCMDPLRLWGCALRTNEIRAEVLGMREVELHL